MKITIAIQKGYKGLIHFAKLMKDALSGAGFEAIVFEIDENSENRQILSKAFSSSDLIVVGGETISWGGDISPELLAFIDKCPYIEGRKIAIFVTKKLWGSREAKKNLMRAVEHRGGFLFDFEIIGNAADAGEYAGRLASIKSGAE